MMMKLLRNPEVAKGLLLYALLAVVFSVAAWLMDSRFGLFTLLVCIVLIGVHLSLTMRRYRRIARLAAEIDKILHGEQQITLDAYAEGELAVLQSEIHKMTVRLREQQQNLVNDKVYLSDSIADISHQIRTPLTSIHLLTELLSKPDLTEKRRYQLCFELRELLRRIDWLITALLKMSKLDAGTVLFKEESILLEDLLQRACAPLLVPLELHGQLLEINAKGSFYGDIAWTCEAIGNIVKNCMEHTPEYGSIRIHAEENALYTEICIEDSGKGISKADLPHIFERFYKGKDADDKSFGIGLALARMIITQQNGIIKADNNQSGGAKFLIRFYKGTI